ncbi:MAG: PD-(D/E)XK nuclease family protein [Opitutae bacterium]|nr:PD-(D/E)XK nuclease family protein [Opitutae bacterium]
MPPRLHFLSWDRPLLPQAVAWLAGDWAGGAPLDLSALLVVVPTRQSGRRLREALAGHAAAHGQAVFPPRVLTPDGLIEAAAADQASRLETLLAWAEIFRAIEPEDFRAVFPVDPPVRDFGWALRLAQEFVRLQAALAEAGLRLADVTECAGDDFAERERWEQLASLEKLHAAKLAALGLRDEQSVKISTAANPTLLAGLARIIVLATPDPLPLALDVLGAHARTLPVDVAVFAPAAEAGCFDAWGRPQPPAWEQRVLALPDFASHLHLCADPAAQAERIAAAARACGEPDGLLAAGVADAEVLPLLEQALGRAGVATFNPEGRARRQEQLYHLLDALAALACEPAFAAVGALARCPDFLALLRARLGPGFSSARWLAGLDELHARHLPADLAAARAHAARSERFAAVAPALAVVDELRAQLAGPDFAAGAAAALAAVFAARDLDLVRDDDARFAEAAAAWTDVLRECAAAAARFPGLPVADWWSLALRIYGDTLHAEEKPAGALELQGWLELLWEDAPHLAVAGLNDGRVPEAIVGDKFLPESLRVQLGLKTNAARFARDAYLLQALAASRATAGRLDLLLGKTSAAGDPLRPSRLLFRCPDAELPARVAVLFGAAESPRPNPAWTRAWTLGPPRREAPGRVAVTALRGWLQCPFRFYLRHVLGLRPVDPAKAEMDALDFGTLCHGALEALGREPALRDCTDAAQLREFLLGELDRRTRAQFGDALALPLLIQVESARQRLGAAAAVQAAERAAGWVIEEVEKKITVVFGGLTVSGKIDRLERHAETGAVRVLDYKTSDSAVAPRAAHFRAPHPGETPPEWAGLVVEGKRRLWADLQLPLYREALAASHPGAAVECGYFNLPKAAGDTGLALWDDYPPELHAAALRCAAGVCAAIRAGEFWPPSEHVRADYDEFAPLFHRGAAASIAWEEKA